MLIKSCSRREKEGVDQRRSFSFSSLDLNSSFGPLSTDEDEGSTIDHRNHSDDDDDDGYIEINLDPPSPQSPGRKLRNENEDNIIDEEKKEGDVEEGDDDDLEFRVSFLEAALPFIGLSSPPSNSYSSLVALPAPNERKVPLFLPMNHLVNTLEGSPIADSIGDDHSQNSAISKADSKQLVLSMSRKGSRTTADGGGMERGMMNMMVKFRNVMSFRWMVASIRRQQRQAVASSPSSSSTPSNYSSQRATSGADSSSRNQKLSKRLLTRRRKPPRLQASSTSNAPEKSRSSVVLLGLGIKLDAIRGLVASDRSVSKGGKHSKSCPGSIKSSPLHHQGGATFTSTLSGTVVYTRDNSVQAAIAHCKKSFCRSEDFSFR